MEFRVFGRRVSITPEQRSLSVDSWLNGISSASGNGAIVSAEDALGISTVLRCVDLISSTMASIGCELYQRKESGPELAYDNDLYEMIMRSPNKETTAFDFISFLVSNMLLTKAGIIWVEKDSLGKVVGLWNLPTAYCSDIHRNTATNERYIDFVGSWRGATKTWRLYDKEIIWIPGRRLNDPDQSMDIISLASRTLGLTRKLDIFATNYFDSGANPSGILTYDGNPRVETFREVIKRFREEYAGASNQNKVMGITSKMKFETLDKREPDKAQALESRKFQVSEICRLFGVPPHLVFEMERATYSNTEQLNVEFVQYGLAPLCVKVEQALAQGLMSPSLRKRYFFRFQTKNLLRGDIKSRTEYYSLMRNGGIMNADEIRAEEDLPKIPGGDGQVYLVNGAMIPLQYAKENRPKNMAKGGANNNGGAEQGRV